MNFEIGGTLLSVLVVVATAFLSGFAKRRGEAAAEKPLATHWREFLTGPWPTRLQWMGLLILAASSVSFLWDMTAKSGPATTQDVARGFFLAIGWAVVSAAYTYLRMLDTARIVVDELRRAFSVMRDRPPPA